MPGSCNSGFRSRPSAAAGNKRSNGSEVVSMNRMNPTLTNPITPSTRATTSSGRVRLVSATETDHTESMNTQSSIDPSCDPHEAATLYCMGSSELEFCATLRTEKSLVTNEWIRQPNANATKHACPIAAG